MEDNVHIRHIPFLKRQIIRILSEPYTEFVHLLSKLKRLCRFEKGGYYKKRAYAKPKMPRNPKRRIKTIKNQIIQHLCAL
ncbi:MAG: hypothetical protein ACP5JW_07230 [Candidatus Bathyarchaeia archaeon]